MLILKSEVSTSPKLKGHSLVSLCKLSLVNSSRLNLSKLTDIVTNFSGGLLEQKLREYLIRWMRQ